MAVEASPGLLRAVDQLEHRGERGLVREASLRADRPVPHGRESAFNGIGGAQVLPMLRREIVKDEQRGGSVCLNSFSGLISGIPAVVMKMMDPRSGTA